MSFSGNLASELGFEVLLCQGYSGACRRDHPLVRCAKVGWATLFTSSLAATVVMLTMVLVGAYSMKGPFWALVSGWLSSSTAAAGLAAVGALANLIGGGLMVNVYGAVHDATGSYALALMPLAATPWH